MIALPDAVVEVLGIAAAGRLSAEEGARLPGAWAIALEVWGGENARRRLMFEEHPLQTA